MIAKIKYGITFEEFIDSMYWELLEKRILNTHGGDNVTAIKQPLELDRIVCGKIVERYK